MIYHKMGKPNQYRRLSKNFLVLDEIGSLFPGSLIPSDSGLSLFSIYPSGDADVEKKLGFSLLHLMQKKKPNQTQKTNKPKTNITDVT